MALQARRFHGKPLLQPNYNFRDVPWCSRDLSGSTLSVVTERQHLVDSIAELTLLCNEATRRSQSKVASSSSVPGARKVTKPLSIEYIFDRIDTDDPIWGLMVRTDTPVSLKGRSSNLKASPLWKRGMLQGFITMTTFTNWQSTFRFDSLHEMAFGQDDEELEEQMKGGLRRYDEDGSLAEELESSVKGGNPHVEGIIYPRIAEVSLFGGLGCGKQLLRLLIEHLECLKSSAQFNYDYIVLQATENSIPFYESMGFTRVGCVQGKAPSPNKYHSSLVEEYFTKKNGETPITVAKEFGVDVWDIVFLNRLLWKDLMQKSWLKVGTKLFIPKSTSDGRGGPPPPKWYMAQNNEMPRGIAKKFGVDFDELLRANKRRYPDLSGNSKLMKGTKIQISRFHIDEGDTVAYSHWTFPDAELDDDEVSYMMAMKLNRKKGNEAKVKPVAFSLTVPMKPYSPIKNGVRDLLLQPGPPPIPLAPIFAKEKPPKEPKKPKRPMNSYAHFMVEARSSMADKLKGLSIGEINRVLSERWKSVWDDDKVRYEELAEKSKAAYNEAMKKYAAEMDEFQRISPRDTAALAGGVDVSLLEKVVKLKPTHGISGVSKFEYFYVLTFIPDLQWCHLIPMRKVGVFGPEYPEVCGRPIWMIVGEEEGKEIDTTAAVCQPVTAITMKNSPDADDEQWNIYDNGEMPPAPPPASNIAPKEKADLPPGAPVKPKRPMTSFAFFCGEASSTMKEQLGNKSMVERTKIFAEQWKNMSVAEKRKYSDQQANARKIYPEALKKYKEDLAKYLSKNPGVDASSLGATLSKTPKASQKAKETATTADGEFQNTSLSSNMSKTPKSAKKVEVQIAKTRDGAAKTPLSTISSKTPKSTMKIKTPELEVANAMSAWSTISSKTFKSSKKAKMPVPECQKRRHPTRKMPEAELNPERNGETLVRKREATRLRNCATVPGTLSTEDMLHTVKKDPIELENFLGKLTDCSQQTHKNATWDQSNEDQHVKEDIVLSMREDCYREIMWRQFNILGIIRDEEKENKICNDVFRMFKQKGGKFFKLTGRTKWRGKKYLVDDDMAWDHILSDIRLRVKTARTWLDGGESEPVEESPRLSPTRSGKRRRQQTSTSEAQVKPQSPPSRSSKQGRQQPKSTAKAQRPQPSPSRYPRRGPQPKPDPPKIVENVQEHERSNASPLRRHSGEEDAHIPSRPADGLPNGWLTRRIPRENPRDSRVDSRWYSPELNLRFRSFQEAKTFAERVEAIGKGEAAAMQSTSPRPKRPLAPIFLKSYGKKKKCLAESEEPKEVARKSSRYPERKRKQITDDSHLVSDDAVSETSTLAPEPKKKRAKTRR
mmetsp:Transcript_33717/g.71874  ORF Transcript_33717/g.71874 Transcript_33717/m.71874 type:complete len:1337 (-) Transcript_33717:99-4109(-)